MVDGLQKKRIKPILDVVIARFHQFSRLQKELTATKAALAERKTAMDQGKKIADVAEAVSALQEAGIAWEIVPGVTAAVSAAASASEFPTERGTTNAVV